MRRASLRAPKSWPSTTTAPRVGASNPDMMWSKEVFPAPERPTRAVTPGPASREQPRRTASGPPPRATSFHTPRAETTHPIGPSSIRLRGAGPRGRVLLPLPMEQRRAARAPGAARDRHLQRTTAQGPAGGLLRAAGGGRGGVERAD
ncbi:hypothetical protein BH719_08915 [Pauljensenia hongkongensis]|uniref:Uncharacterized protein n=1 Tax=Pauljensenia hongkongensis TaxID=178339 RepID=A0A1D8B461_9ACTO|nr:hypothetical protein BH719_08915 [Pauljensenia hongkongensis]